MLKLICPKCMKPVSVPDDFAGREVTCPSCMKTFDAPAKYTPTVLDEPTGLGGLTPPARQETKPSPLPESSPMSPDVPPAPTHTEPPPGLVPPTPPTPPTPPPVPPPAPEAAASIPRDYTRSVGFAISPKAVAWLPAILLTVTLFSTFFAWIGSYLGGYAVYSQGPWRAAFGGTVKTEYALAERASIPSGWQDKLTSDWELLVPFFLALILAVSFAWADRGLNTLDPRKVPPLARIWPWRKWVILALAALAFTLVLIQVCLGLGMERAIRQSIRENPALVKEREEAGASQSKQAVVANKEEQELAKYNLERTIWLYLALTCNALAVLLLLAHIGLERRGDKPPPRIVVQY